MKKIFCVICTIIFIYNLCALPSAATISPDDIAILREDITKRGEYEKHYILEDGSYLAALYSEPVCYKDEKGNWIEIDNSIEKSGDKYKNKNSQLQVSFSKNASEKEMVNLHNNNNSLTWGLSFESVSNIETSKRTNGNMQKSVSPNASEIEYTNVFEKEDDITAAKNIESHVSYKNIYSNTVDVKYTVLPEKVKENIIITEPSDFTSYSMNIICDDLTAILTKDNSVEFVDKTGKLQYEILTPYMYDNIYELSYNINIEVKESTDGYIITFTPDKEWLNSPDRVYPIVIDPTVNTGTTKANFSDTYIYEGSTASKSRALEERLRVGIYNSLIYRVLWKTSVLPTLPTGANISSATFNLKLPSVTTTSRTFSLYKINSSWASYTITWASANSLSTSLLKSGVSRNSSENTLTFSGTNVTNAVKSWYSGTANNGFLIRYTSESLTNPDYNVFYSSDNTTSTSYMPRLTITYSTSNSNSNSNTSSTALPLSEYPVGSYFTDNGSACTDHAKKECSYSDPIACNCKIYADSIQCMGFAKYVYAEYSHMTKSEFSAMYSGGTEKSNKNKNLAGSATIAKSVLQSLPIGSYVRFTRADGGEHSVIILSTSNSQVTFYECNYDRKCGVSTRTVTYAKVASEYATIELTLSHNFSASSDYSKYNASEHKVKCANTNCTGYIYEAHTSGTCICGYSS